MTGVFLLAAFQAFFHEKTKVKKPISNWNPFGIRFEHDQFVNKIIDRVRFKRSNPWQKNT